jgi:pyruvate kinase
MSVAGTTQIPVRQKLVKTRIIATVGPASESIEVLRELVISGVDIFRLNFAHGEHAWLSELVRRIRQVSAELDCPIGILGDLSGPKIRLARFRAVM